MHRVFWNTVQVRAGEMAQLVRYLPCREEDMGSMPRSYENKRRSRLVSGWTASCSSLLGEF